MSKAEALEGNLVDVTVTEKIALTDNITAFRLKASDSSVLPVWEPGAHIEISLPNGLIRQYSLCGTHQQQTYEIAVLKEKTGRGGSIFLHDKVNVGDTLSISAPKNHFALNTQDKKRVFLAAGIGLTPILAMAEHSTEIHYDFVMCAKNKASTPYLERVMALSNVALHFSESAGGRLDIARVLTQYDLDADVYVCGPQHFIDDVVKQCHERGWSEANVHREYFGFTAQDDDETERNVFTVKVQSSGELIPVQADQTISQALESKGIFVPVACEEGVCGTCITNVLEGEPAHRDVFLTDEEKAEGKHIMVCCSRAKSATITLEL